MFLLLSSILLFIDNINLKVNLMNDAVAHPVKRNATAKTFNLLLSGLMIVMTITSGLALIFGFGFIVSDSFYNWAAQSASFNGLSGEDVAGISRQTLVLSALSGALIAGSFVIISYLLKRLLSTLIQGDPFVPENIARLRKIWIILALAEAFRMVASTMISYMDPSDVMSISLDIRFTSWFLVFVIATVAEVFRHGTAIRQEQKYTI